MAPSLNSISRQIDDAVNSAKNLDLTMPTSPTLSSISRHVGTAVKSVKNSNLAIHASPALNSMTRRVRGAATLVRKIWTRPTTPKDQRSIATYSNHSSSSVTSEMTIPSPAHSFVVIPGTSQESILVTIASLNDMEVIELCVEHLFLDVKTEYMRDVLVRGVEILEMISYEWFHTSAPLETLHARIISELVHHISLSDQRALYHALDALVKCSSWLDVERHHPGFETTPMLWALQLGPRGLAQGWEDNMSTVEILKAAERNYLAASGDVPAVRNFGRDFREWGIEMCELMETKEDDLRT